MGAERGRENPNQARKRAADYKRAHRKNQTRNSKPKTPAKIKHTQSAGLPAIIKPTSEKPYSKTGSSHRQQRSRKGNQADSAGKKKLALRRKWRRRRNSSDPATAGANLQSAQNQSSRIPRRRDETALKSQLTKTPRIIARGLGKGKISSRHQLTYVKGGCKRRLHKYKKICV